MYTRSMETIYLSLVHTGSWGYLFHEIPGSVYGVIISWPHWSEPLSRHTFLADISANRVGPLRKYKFLKNGWHVSKCKNMLRNFSNFFVKGNYFYLFFLHNQKHVKKGFTLKKKKNLFFVCPPLYHRQDLLTIFNSKLWTMDIELFVALTDPKELGANNKKRIRLNNS